MFSENHQGKKIIDGTGAGILIDYAILVEAGRIQEISPWQQDEFRGEILDLGDVTVLPGLIDTHLHFMLDPRNPEGYFDPEQSKIAMTVRTIANVQESLRAGVTTAGDCGALNEIIFPVRDAINNGELVGPRILSSGNPLVPAGGHGEQMGRIAKGVKQVREAVRIQAEAGADFIKVMATAGGGEDPGKSHYSREELTALRKEAEKYGLVVAAHAHGSQGIRDCILAGIQRIEHCTFFNGEEGFDFDSQAAQAIADQGIIVSPTNVIDYRRIEQNGKGAPRAEHNQIWRSLLDHGVSFSASSDAGVTDIVYDDFALIPELMVTELGMSAMDALIACTWTAAKALRLDDEIGTLEAGKQADLIAVLGNPLEDIKNCRNISMVMRDGHQICF